MLLQWLSIFSDEIGNLHLTVFNPSRIGEGEVFVGNPEHIVNMPAESMSLIPHEDYSFVDYLSWKGIHDSFPPRRYFGEYSRSIAAKCISDLTNIGHTVTLCNENVTKLSITANGRYALKTDTSDIVHTFDSVILATGEKKSTIPINFQTSQIFFETPFDSRIKDINPHSSVAILGSSLSAMDALATLKTNQHLGPITVHSRKGLLPAVRPNNVFDCENNNFSELGFSKICTVKGYVDFNDAVNALEADLLYYISSYSRGHIRRNLYNIDPKKEFYQSWFEATVDSNNIYSVLNSSSGGISRMWSMMDYKSKKYLLSKFSSEWNYYRHPTPIKNAQLVHEYFNSSQLSTVRTTQSGRVVNHKYEIQYLNGVRKYDYVINATGTYKGILRSLEQSLIRQGILSLSINDDIEVDYQSMQAINVFGEKQKNLYVVGPTTSGVHFYTNAIQTNLENSGRLIKLIIATRNKEVTYIA